MRGALDIMKKVLFKIMPMLLLLCCFAVPAFALPTLQLAIEDGWYYDGPSTTTRDTETSISSTPVFTLYALLDPEGKVTGGSAATVDDLFYISAALYPKVPYTDMNLGSFTFGTQTFNVTTDMDYGNPPLEKYLTRTNEDLQKHGIYPTFFTEFAFQFDRANMAIPYNAQDNPDGFVEDLSDTSNFYFNAFSVDASGLTGDWTIHFDLYTKNLISGVDEPLDYKIGDFAPFSHDAQSGGDDIPPGNPIPEPGTMMLLGAGLLGLAGISRKKLKK